VNSCLGAIDDAGREHCVIGGRHVVPFGFQRRPGLLLAKIGSVLSERADEALAETGLNGRDYAVLAVLADDDPATQNEIAVLVATAPRVIVAVLDRLEDAGLVQRARDPDDRRRSRVTLTGEGRRVLRRAESAADRAVSEVLPGLDAVGRSQLQELLDRGIHPIDARHDTPPRGSLLSEG
jgi:DNA-binding MarR family transcriptional regulator